MKSKIGRTAAPMAMTRCGPKISSAILCLFLLMVGCAANKELAVKAPFGNGSPFLVAVLPVENLSGRRAPLKQLRLLLAEGLQERGVGVLPEGELEKFMFRHRMRYTGGIDKEMAQALLQETGTKAILITSVEYFSEIAPPKIAFLTRLVSTGDSMQILWTKDFGNSGDDHPGILSLGMVDNPSRLMKNAVSKALNSLVLSIPGGMSRILIREIGDPKQYGWQRARFQPRRFYRSPEIGSLNGRILTVAVVPFLNDSTRKNAGEVMALHLLNRFAEFENIRLIEPGKVRQEFLRLRIIMQDGLSHPQADLLLSMLEADLLVIGNVSSYQDYEGPSGDAMVGFSIMMFERKSRRVVWSSRSYNKRDDHVIFFDWGELKTAGTLASEMARAVVEQFLENETHAEDLSGKGSR